MDVVNTRSRCPRTTGQRRQARVAFDSREKRKASRNSQDPPPWSSSCDRFIKFLWNRENVSLVSTCVHFSLLGYVIDSPQAHMQRWNMLRHFTDSISSFWAKWLLPHWYDSLAPSLLFNFIIFVWFAAWISWTDYRLASWFEVFDDFVYGRDPIDIVPIVKLSFSENWRNF